MNLRHLNEIRVLRHPSANFGNGEWFLIRSFSTKEEAEEAFDLLVKKRPDERFRLYSEFAISRDSGSGKAEHINVGIF